MPRPDLRDRLAAGPPLLADGATGTQLAARGLATGECSERWVLQRPDVVGAIAADYAAAGSDLIYTNSFGANPWRLKPHGLADRLEELNVRAAEVVREAVGADRWTVGSMGPTGDFLEPLGGLTAEAAAEGYARQAAALVAGGVDALVCETFSALDELLAAVAGIRSVTDLPLLTTLTYGAGGRTMMGVAPAQAITALVAAGVDVVGLNCGDSVEVVVPVLTAYRAAAPAAVLMAKPNAGLPQIVAGEPVWPLSPEEFASLAESWLAAGARVIGGCCGSTPAHLAALARLRG